MHRRSPAKLCRLGAVLAAAAASAAIGAASASATLPTNYDNFPSPLPGNAVSEAFQATQTGQFGGQIELAGTIGAKTAAITVGMSSFACQEGTWNAGNCRSSGTARFEWPVTLRIYTVGVANALGTQIAQVTKKFKMPYRPSASTRCKGASAGAWYFRGQCFNGKLFKIAFTLKGVVLPAKSIISVAYNTSGYGAEPQGYSNPCNSTPAGCYYDSLNVGLTEPANPEKPEPVAPSVGADPAPEDAYQDSATASNYCDGGVGGTGKFRLDSGVPPCWTGYQPLLKVATG
jgi:hypothetical protein